MKNTIYKSTKSLKISAIVLALVATNASAKDATQLLTQVSNILAKPDALQVSFKQVKQVKGFKAPLTSSGHILIARDRGILWITETPYQSALRVTPNGISEIRGGQSTQIGNAQSMKSMSAIMSGMLAGNFSPLQRYFRFSGNASGSRWSLSLTPLDANVARAISGIQMSGGHYVNHVTVRESNGDVANIELSGASPIAASSTGL